MLSDILQTISNAYMTEKLTALPLSTNGPDDDTGPRPLFILSVWNVKQNHFCPSISCYFAYFISRRAKEKQKQTCLDYRPKPLVETPGITAMVSHWYKQGHPVTHTTTAKEMKGDNTTGTNKPAVKNPPRLICTISRWNIDKTIIKQREIKSYFLKEDKLNANISHRADELKTSVKHRAEELKLMSSIVQIR